VAIVLAEGSAPWVPAWLARAEAATVRRLEDDVDQALATGDLDPAALPALSVSPAEALALAFPAGVQTGDVTRGGAEDASGDVAPCSAARDASDWRWRSRVRIHGPAPVIRLLRACLFTVQRRIERRAGRPSSQGEALEALLDHVLESWWVAAYGAASPRAIPREHRVRIRGTAPDRLRFEMPLGTWLSGDRRLS